jgi:Tfp pilus assembly protein PilV
MITMHKRQGFNLVECLIACTLICGMAVALFGVWEMHAKATAQTRDYVIGAALAEQEMENCLSLGYTVTNSTQDYSINHIVENVTIPRTFHAKTEVYPIVTSATSGMKLVNVTVYWDDPGSKTGNHTVHLTTQLSWEG